MFKLVGYFLKKGNSCFCSVVFMFYFSSVVLNVHVYKNKHPTHTNPLVLWPIGSLK